MGIAAAAEDVVSAWFLLGQIWPNSEHVIACFGVVFFFFRSYELEETLVRV